MSVHPPCNGRVCSAACEVVCGLHLMRSAVYCACCVLLPPIHKWHGE